MNKEDFEHILSEEFLSPEIRAAFLSMSPEDQQLSILAMQAYLRKEVAVIKKHQLEFEQSTSKYRNYREKKENEKEDDVVSISQRIALEVRKALDDAFSKRFDFWIYLRDKVLPGIISLFILIMLYLIFTQWHP